MKYVINRKKPQGKIKAIGLLELMLSLAIIAVLLIMATRYYSSASSSQKIQAGVDQVNAVKSAMQNYANAGMNSEYTSATIGSLVQAGYLPSNFLSSASASTAISPWGGVVKLTPSTTYFEVSMDTQDESTCQAVEQKIEATSTPASGAGVTAPSCGGTNSATLYYYFSY